MKKLKLLLFMILFIPINIFAVSITDISLSGSDEGIVNEKISLTYTINFDNLEKKNYDNVGVYAVLYNLNINKDILDIVSVSSEYWDTLVYLNEDKYQVLSVVNEKNTHKCQDNVLSCGDYSETFEFLVKETKEEKINIEIGEVEVWTSPFLDTNLPKEKDIKSIKSESISAKILKINQGDKKEKVEVKPLDIKKEKLNVNSKYILSLLEKTFDKEKNSNNYIKKLEIEGYELSFSKDNNEYYLTIPAYVKSLPIKVDLESDKATYEIDGNDSIESNKILIVVTSFNGDKNTYTINLKREEVKEDETIKEKIENVLDDKDLLKRIGIIFGIIIFIVFIIRLILRLRDRKMDKMLNKL